MPLSSLLSCVQYNGNGSTTAFSVTFPFFDLDVVLVASDGSETPWTEGTQYSVVSSSTATYGDGNTGTLNVSTSPTDYTPASGTKLRIQRQTSRTQDTDLSEGDSFPPQTIEDAFNILTMIAQELQHGNSIHFVRDIGGTKNAITGKVYPAITSYRQARFLCLVPALDGDDAGTINLNSIGAIDIVADWSGTDLSDDLVADTPVFLIYDHTNNRYVKASSGGASTGGSSSKRYVCTVGGTAQAITLTTGNSLTTLRENDTFMFMPTSNITAADPTVAVDSAGELTLYGPNSQALAADEVHTGRWYEAMAVGGSTPTSLVLVGGYE